MAKLLLSDEQHEVPEAACLVLHEKDEVLFLVEHVKGKHGQFVDGQEDGEDVLVVDGQDGGEQDLIVVG